MNEYMDTGVYRIRNIVTNQCYVGSSSASLQGRIKTHKRNLSNGVCHNIHLQRAWDKYGSTKFKFSFLEYCPPDECIEREQWWMDELHAATDGYNFNPTAGSPRGIIRSAATRAKISVAGTLKVVAVTTIEKIGSVHIGRRCSDKTKKKMSIAQKARSKQISQSTSRYWKGRPKSEESIRKMAASLTGRRLSPESIAKTAAANRGRICSEETKRKIGVANTGAYRSPENREKIRQSLLGKKLSEEIKAKLRASQTARRLRERTERESTNNVSSTRRG